MPIYLLVKSFIKKAIEKRSYYSDTPGKFALLKELKRNFLQIFVVDSSCFCNFVAENEDTIVRGFCTMPEQRMGDLLPSSL